MHACLTGQNPSTSLQRWCIAFFATQWLCHSGGSCHTEPWDWPCLLHSVDPIARMYLICRPPLQTNHCQHECLYRTWDVCHPLSLLATLCGVPSGRASSYAMLPQAVPVDQSMSMHMASWLLNGRFETLMVGVLKWLDWATGAQDQAQEILRITTYWVFDAVSIRLVLIRMSKPHTPTIQCLAVWPTIISSCRDLFKPNRANSPPLSSGRHTVSGDRDRFSCGGWDEPENFADMQGSVQENLSRIRPGILGHFVQHQQVLRLKGFWHFPGHQTCLGQESWSWHCNNDVPISTSWLTGFMFSWAARALLTNMDGTWKEEAIWSHAVPLWSAWN